MITSSRAAARPERFGFARVPCAAATPGTSCAYTGPITAYATNANVASDFNPIVTTPRPQVVHHGPLIQIGDVYRQPGENTDEFVNRLVRELTKRLHLSDRLGISKPRIIGNGRHPVCDHGVAHRPDPVALLACPKVRSEHDERERVLIIRRYLHECFGDMAYRQELWAVFREGRGRHRHGVGLNRVRHPRQQVKVRFYAIFQRLCAYSPAVTSVISTTPLYEQLRFTGLGSILDFFRRTTFPRLNDSIQLDGGHQAARVGARCP